MRGFRRLATPAAALIALAATGAGSAAQKRHASHATPTAATPQQVVTGPVADYWMSASTASGFGSAFMGGGRPSMGALFGAATGRNTGPTKSLTLVLGSTQPPSGPPQADHFPPPALGVGADLPLLTPDPPKPGEPERSTSDDSSPRQPERPKGRLLIFWGCGEHAAPGQPFIFDFATLGANMPMPDFGAGLQVRAEHPPSYGDRPGFGRWPNAKTRVKVPATASLAGPHAVKGDYTPDIAFIVGPELDFLPAFDVADSGATPQGGRRLTWAPAPQTGGYYLQMFGAGGGRNPNGGGDVVFWSSSSVKVGFGAFGLNDYLPPDEVQRLVRQRAVLAPSTGECVVPAEVAQAAPSGLVTGIAYGPEQVFTDPPRPASGPWNIRWRAHVRVKATSTLILGMGAAMRGAVPKPSAADVAGHLLGGFRPF